MVPVVDLQGRDAQQRLGEALAGLGFAELVGHGLDDAVVSALRQACDGFFALDEDTKRRFVHPEPLANRGFRAKGSEALAYSLGDATPPDLFESFNCGADRVDGWSDLIQPTPWPDDVVPLLRRAAHSHLAQMARLAYQLDEWIGDLLGIDGLADRSTQGPDTMACIDYRPAPDGTEAVVEGQQRMGAHSDYTSFTLLVADPVPGLQIVDPDRGWVDVVPRPGSVLMNVGDLLAMWTNDLWPSTLHRVVPMHAGGAPTRRSVAYFHYPDLDVVVSPLAGAGSNYRPVTVEDHLRGKLASPKVKTAPTSASTAGDRPH
jgi:isopenicillin N synthase-like dioxygenase